jgi:hypothetical protein
MSLLFPLTRSSELQILKPHSVNAELVNNFERWQEVMEGTDFLSQ